MLNCPDVAYFTHLADRLPAVLAQNPEAHDQLARLRTAVEPLLLMDLGKIAADLESLLPQRQGGRAPWDRKVIFRSLFLCATHGGGRINQWVQDLQGSALLRVLIGAEATGPAPSVATHYRFAAQVLRGSDLQADGSAGARHAEVAPGQGGAFLRTLRKPAAVRDARAAKTSPAEGVCEDVRRLLKQRGELPVTASLDARLMQWVAALALPLLDDAGLLPRQLWLVIDGTVTRSHGSRRPVPRSAELLGESEAEGTRSNEELDEANDEATHPTGEASTVSGARRQGRGAGRRGRGKSRAPKSQRAPERPAYYSDPTATFRYSTATDKLEYGHLSLGLSTRNGSDDVPLFFAGARAHEGETPAGMRMLHQASYLLERYAPSVKVRGLIADAGYDAAAVYRMCGDHDWVPIIDSQRSQVDPGDTPRMPDGCTPICPGEIGYKLHQRSADKLTYRCPALVGRRESSSGKHTWQFDRAACPLGTPCSKVQESYYLTLLTSDNLRMNLPVPRGSAAWKERMRSRTVAERLFSGLHGAIRHRTYRRAHLVEITGSMYWLSRQLRLVAAKRRAELDAFWEQFTPPPLRTAA